MQNQSDKKFDEFIHSEMEDLVVDPSFDEAWNKMALELDKGKFYRFAPFRFNLYYLLAILFILAGILYWVFQTDDKPLPEGNAKGKQESKILSNRDVKNCEDEEKEENKNAEYNLHDSAIGTPVSKDKDRLSKEKQVITIPEIKVPQDSIPVAVEIKQSAPVVKASVDSVVKKAPKKIKYVTRRDTIITLDTTKIRKKR